MKIQLREKSSVPKAGKVFCGIDQGVSGAIAFLWETSGTVEVYDMPTVAVPTKKSPRTGKMGKKKQLDFARIRSLLRLNIPLFTVIEKPIISKEGREGKTTIATTHYNAGVIAGMVFMTGIPHANMRPQQWQKHFFPGKKGDTKGLSYLTACELFPNYCHFFVGPRGAKLHGRTDALLMAETARRIYYGGDL